MNSLSPFQVPTLIPAQVKKSALRVAAGGLLLALVAACGGGGGGSSTPPPSAKFTIGGTVSGLSGSGLVLDDNGGDALTVSGNGTFTFATGVAAGGAYAVTVATQPANPAQTCTVTNASGTASANVTNVTVSCASNSYTVGGTVSGLTGTGLVLQDNGGDNLAVSANGTFTFATALATGKPYAVTVLTQPSGQNCTVSSGTGSIASANITSVAVACGANSTVAKFVYTANSADGTISQYSVAPSSGVLTAIPGGPVQVGTGVGTSPAAVSLSPDGKWAFSAFSAGTKIAAFKIDTTSGALTAINTYSTGFVTGSKYPDIAVDPSSKFLYLASEGDNKVAGFAIDQTSGALTAVAGSPFPAGSGAAGIPAFSPNGKFVYVVNQGDSTVSGYAMDSGTGVLTSVGPAVAAGSGAAKQMWIAFTPDGTLAYVSNGAGNQIWAYTVNTSTGVLTPAGVGAAAITDTDPRDLTVHPSGKFLYVPCFTTSTIEAFSINAATGALILIGKVSLAANSGPMFVDVDPSGRFAYVSSSTSSAGVYGYTIDQTTGALTAMTGSPFAAGSNPVFVIADASGKYAYAANQMSGNISGYSINQTSGVLTAVAGSPFPAGNQPFVVSMSPEAPGIRD